MGDILNLILKTIIIYISIFLSMKFMGKREVGQLSLFDFIVLLLIADVSVVSIDTTRTIVDCFYSLIPIITLVIIQKIIAYILLKIPKLRNFFDGKSVILIDNGILDIKKMKKERYNIDDLLSILRINNIDSFSKVKYLILEANGDISIFKYDDILLYDTIFPIITSGVVHEENLIKFKIDKKWLEKEIKKKGYKDFSEVYFAAFENNNLFILNTIE